jgi:hypothetical protein
VTSASNQAIDAVVRNLAHWRPLVSTPYAQTRTPYGTVNIHITAYTAAAMRHSALCEWRYCYVRSCNVVRPAYSCVLLALQVFGNSDRLGAQAVHYTMEGRLRADPELRAWRHARSMWRKALHLVQTRMQQLDMQWCSLPGMLVSSTYSVPTLPAIVVTQFCCAYIYMHT